MASSGGVAFMLLLIVVSFVVELAIALHVGRDMNRRGQPGWVYALLVVFLPCLVGVVVWLVVRENYPLQA